MTADLAKRFAGAALDAAGVSTSDRARAPAELQHAAPAGTSPPAQGASADAIESGALAGTLPKLNAYVMWDRGRWDQPQSRSF